ncbi:unnamed protein product [Acanthoscelides obtectus]|uniref:Uncharacterized protein n=1 Tax=Acanthoscelides obtectus TaxID=200917 RepID=A0A9P0PW66_ACAOB|nr:unnamed protein product [Acanthoscelides obtectus]CAK1685872.1 hypothetical protein AOBTE_LOCUS35683 [Acanthoscelides obtectus]
MVQKCQFQNLQNTYPELSSESNDEQTDDDIGFEDTVRINQPKPFTQGELNDPTRDLCPSKESAQFLGSRLRENNLLATGTTIYWYRVREEELRIFLNKIKTQHMISPRTEAKWQQWYEEVESDVGSELDINDAASEHSLHATNTEQSSDSDDEDICLPLSLPALKKIPHFTGKDGTPWKNCTKTRIHYIFGKRAYKTTRDETSSPYKYFFSSWTKNSIDYWHSKKNTPPQNPEQKPRYEVDQTLQSLFYEGFYCTRSDKYNNAKE